MAAGCVTDVLEELCYCKYDVLFLVVLSFLTSQHTEERNGNKILIKAFGPLKRDKVHDARAFRLAGYVPTREAEITEEFLEKCVEKDLNVEQT